MDYVTLGRSDLKVSVVGLGAWQWGSSAWGWGKEYGREEVKAAFERALELGINFVDTAELYGGGLSEQLLGEFLRSRRNEVVVATKVSPWHLRYGSVLKAAANSLKRLAVSTIDLYQLHWPNPVVPIKSTMKAMEKLVRDGKVRHIGVSNFGRTRLQAANEALARSQIVSNQVKYNLLQRTIEKELLPYAKEQGISIIAYSPLAQGLLTGKYAETHLPPKGVRSFNVLFSPRNLKRVSPLLNVLREIGRERGKTVAQVALNWLIKDPAVFTIPGAKNPKQIEENAGASGWQLNRDELQRIEVAWLGFKPDRVQSILRLAVRAIFR